MHEILKIFYDPIVLGVKFGLTEVKRIGGHPIRNSIGVSLL
jgi:hypothetical protein